jgi:hypothetical protein
MCRKLFLVILLLSIFPVANIALAQSSMKLPIDSYDFGYVPQNASISHGFWLYSDGKDTLKITNVKTGCGCTKAPLEKYILAPGDSTLLEIIFSTGHSSGRMAKSVHIFTNTEKADYQLTISSNILRGNDSTLSVVVAPNILTLPQPSENNSKKISFDITNLSNNELAPSLVEYPRDLFEIKLPKKIKAGKTAEGILKIKSDNSPQSFQKSITFEINDQNKTRFTIPVIKNALIGSSAQTSKN